MAKKSAKVDKPFMLPNLLVFGLFRRPGCAADIIHRAYIIYYWRQCRTIGERLIVLKEFLISPFPIIKDIRMWSGKLGSAVAKCFHKSVFRQWLEQFYLSYFFSINSENYYLQEFYREDGLEKARHFVNKGAIKNGVYRLLTAYGRYLNREHEVVSLGKKSKFFKFCLKKEVPVVPVLMEILADGTIIDYREGLHFPGELPKENLFCKPNRDNEGEGAEVWFWKGEQNFQNPEGKNLCSQELLETLINLARQHKSGSYIVQPLALPHHDLAVFRKNATPTLRLITYVNLDGKILVDSGMFKFSVDPLNVVDNANAGGMIAPIDLDTGMLGAAVDDGLNVLGTRWEKHEDNNALIKGRILPFWKETLDVVKKGHALFPYRLLIGWDVLITEQGPVILEGNSQPGLCFIQRAHLQPMGKMGVGKAVASYCRRAVKTLYNGVIGSNSLSGKDKIDLYGGCRIKRWLSWFLISNRKKVRLQIEGKVQGVGYRRWLRKQARAHKLSGWAHNLPDGTVEAVLRGRAVDVEDVAQACWIGPKSANVKLVKASWFTGQVKRGFMKEITKSS